MASTKEVIVKEAESLANSKDWLNTAKRFKVLMDQWKASGRGKKSTDDALWNRFKASQDTFSQPRTLTWQNVKDQWQRI